MKRKTNLSGANLTESDFRVIEIIKENGPTSKTEAPDFDMAITTFQLHAKKLESLGLLKSEKQITGGGRGRSRIVYDLK